MKELNFVKAITLTISELQVIQDTHSAVIKNELIRKILSLSNGDETNSEHWKFVADSINTQAASTRANEDTKVEHELHQPSIDGFYTIGTVRGLVNLHGVEAIREILVDKHRATGRKRLNEADAREFYVRQLIQDNR